MWTHKPLCDAHTAEGGAPPRAGRGFLYFVKRDEPEMVLGPLNHRAGGVVCVCVCVCV